MIKTSRQLVYPNPMIITHWLHDAKVYVVLTQ